MILHEAYLTGALAFGAAVALHDRRTRRVPNRAIAAGLALAFAGYAWLALNTALGSTGRVAAGLGRLYLPWSFFAASALHLTLALAAAVALWRLGAWPAGDAKLYLTLAALLPLAEPNLFGFPKVPFLALLINTFLPAGLFFAADACVSTLARRSPGETLKGRLVGTVEKTLRRLSELKPFAGRYAALTLNAYLFFVVTQFAARLLAPRLNDPLGQAGLFLALALVWRPLRGALSRPAATAALSASLAAAHWAAPSIDWPGLFQRAVLSWLGFGVALAALQSAIAGWLRRLERRVAPTAELDSGCLLDDGEWERVQALARERGEEPPRRYADGLSADEAASARRWLESAGVQEVGVMRAAPFSAWIVLGAALTLFSRRHAAYWLVQAVRAGAASLGLAERP